MGHAYGSTPSTMMKKNSLPSALPEGWCRSHMNEGSYFTLGLRRAQRAWLESGERREERKEEEEGKGKQCNRAWICP